MLIGNKIDLDEQVVIEEQDGAKFAKEHEMLFIQTSALESTNVEKAFHLILEEICDKID